MATYCISDIHGHKEEFDEMLSLIGFCADDELYILGDIIDRGPGSAELLCWAVDEAGDNIHFLLGNHEDMARYVLARDPVNLNCLRREDPWAFNHGLATLTQLEELTDARWREEKLLPWLAALEPVQLGVKVGDREFALVHAGFDPLAFDSHPKGWKLVDGFVDYDCSYDALRKTYELPKGLGNQFSQFMLWIRTPWLLDDEPAPVETVFGHSCVKHNIIELLKEQGCAEASGGSGRIFHFHNKHGIDCGCAYSSHGPFENGGIPSLGCLRLDDMKEFYVPAKSHVAPKWLF